MPFRLTSSRKRDLFYEVLAEYRPLIPTEFPNPLISAAAQRDESETSLRGFFWTHERHVMIETAMAHYRRPMQMLPRRTL